MSDSDSVHLDYINSHFTIDEPGQKRLNDRQKIVLCEIADELMAGIEWNCRRDPDEVIEAFFQALDEIWKLVLKYEIPRWHIGRAGGPVALFIDRVSVLRNAQGLPSELGFVLADTPVFTCPDEDSLRWQPLLWLTEYEGEVVKARYRTMMMVRPEHHTLH